MRNIYLLLSDKPSRLCYRNYWFLNESGITKSSNVDFYHLYIISDEIPTEGDALMRTDTSRVFCTLKGANPSIVQKYCRKIILTSDPSLEGVQQIDDAFLEWFVKNPSCKKVEVNDWLDDNGNIAWGGEKRYQICNHLYDKIIIPQTLTNFKKGEKYIQQDGVIILAGEKGTDGMVIIDPKKMWGVGYYRDTWNPKAFRLFEEPKQDYSGVHLTHCYQGEYEDRTCTNNCSVVCGECQILKPKTNITPIQLINDWKKTLESEWIQLDNLDEAKLVFDEKGNVVVENEHGVQFPVSELSDVELDIFYTNLS